MRKIVNPKAMVGMLLFLAVPLLAQTIPADSLYLGQTPPGNTPIVFNLPVTSGFRPCERIAITSDGKEIYYAEINTYPPSELRIRCFRYLDNKWQGPTNVFEGFMAPKLSPDDSTIYLQDNSFYTYVSRRLNGGWSTPKRLIAQSTTTHYLQKTNLNNFYASTLRGNLGGDICKLKMGNGDTLLQNLGIPLNSSIDENDFLIAADESYIIVSRTPGGSAADMYISFKKENGKWTNPKSLGEPINKPGYNWEYGQFVSIDGKYLFFTSGGLSWSSYHTYWIKIDNIIDSLRNTNFAPYLNYQIPNQSGLTGQSFSYNIPDSTFVDDDGNNTLTYAATLSNGSSLPSWLSFNPAARTFAGTPTSAVNLSLKVTASDNANASASCSFNINVTVTGIDDNRGHIPSDINLYQNYPNPFNPATTIEFAIPKDGRYTLTLYNILGQLVKEISDQEYDAGYYKEKFDANGLTSGTYIYRLKGDVAEVVRKMVLIQ